MTTVGAVEQEDEVRIGAMEHAQETLLKARMLLDQSEMMEVLYGSLVYGPVYGPYC